MRQRAIRVAIALAVAAIVVPPQPATAAGRCSTATGSVEARVAAFWQCVGSLGPSDLLTAEDLGQWARNVIERDPGAKIRVRDFRDSTAGMQAAIERASAGVPPAPPKSADVEDRIARFWQKVDALGSCDTLTATDLGQWALNVIDRDPSRQIRVDDFRASTAGMQTAMDGAGASCSQATPGTCAGAAGPYAVCGRVTRADTGAPVAGAKVTVKWGHDPYGEAITDANGRYTATARGANDNYTVYAQVEGTTGLASRWHGGALCQFAAPLVSVRGHMTNVDVSLLRGYKLSILATDPAGIPLVGAGQSIPHMYVPEWDTWCGLDTGAPSSVFEPGGAETRVYPAGTYRILFDNSQAGQDKTRPSIWYPAALTANSAKDVVLDRDLTGSATLRITVPTGYAISGKLVPPGGPPWIQVVTMDGGKLGVVAEGYPNDFSAYTYSFIVPPGTYRVRQTVDAVAFRTTYWYYKGGVTTYEAATPVVVTNANVAGIDIAR